MSFPCEQPQGEIPVAHSIQSETLHLAVASWRSAAPVKSSEVFAFVPMRLPEPALNQQEGVPALEKPVNTIALTSLMCQLSGCNGF